MSAFALREDPEHSLNAEAFGVNFRGTLYTVAYNGNNANFHRIRIRQPRPLRQTGTRHFRSTTKNFQRTHRYRAVRAPRITGLSRSLWTGTHLNHPTSIPRVNTGGLYHSRGGLKTAHFGGGLYRSLPRFGRGL